MPFDAAMTDGQPTLATLVPPATDAQAHDAMRGARAMFQRTLASWASDMLILQHRGLHEPTWASAAAAHGMRKAA